MKSKKSPDLGKFNHNSVKIEQQTVAWQGFFQVESLKLRHQLFGGGWSKTLSRELFKRGNAVGVLLYDPITDRVGLLEQFRVGALNEPTPWLIEIVAGMIEQGESPDQVAQRELSEEADISNATLLPIGDFLLTPGGCDEKIYLFCGISSLPEQEKYLGLEEEAEDIHYFTVERCDAFQMLETGKINNAAAAIALFWLQLHYQSLQNQFADINVK